MTVQTSSKSRSVLRFAGQAVLAGVARDGAGRPVTVAAITRVAWVVAYTLGMASLVLSMRWGYTPAAGVLILIAVFAGLLGAAGDRLKGRLS